MTITREEKKIEFVQGGNVNIQVEIHHNRAVGKSELHSISMEYDWNIAAINNLRSLLSEVVSVLEEELK